MLHDYPGKNAGAHHTEPDQSHRSCHAGGVTHTSPIRRVVPAIDFARAPAVLGNVLMLAVSVLRGILYLQFTCQPFVGTSSCCGSALRGGLG